MRVWRIATQSPDYAADDLSGTGAKMSGGRWNSRGLAVLYCADSPSLACLETLVHLGAGGLPLQRYLVAIDIPDGVWKSREIHTPDAGSALPSDWKAFPAAQASMGFGNAWLIAARSAVMVLPSAIVAEDRIILINPQHKHAAQITASIMRKWQYDARLFLK